MSNRVKMIYCLFLVSSFLAEMFGVAGVPLLADNEEGIKEVLKRRD
jgi:hypothetical protein